MVEPKNVKKQSKIKKIIKIEFGFILLLFYVMQNNAQTIFSEMNELLIFRSLQPRCEAVILGLLKELNRSNFKFSFVLSEQGFR